MNTNVFSRVWKISLAACLALALGNNFAEAGHYGRSYSHHHHRPMHGGYGGYGGYGRYNPPSFGGYHRPPQYCRPHFSQPRYGGYSGGYQGGSYGRYR